MTYHQMPQGRFDSLQRYILLIVLALMAGLLWIGYTRPFDEPSLSMPEFGRPSLAFVPNAGQSDAAVQYQAHLPGANLFFTNEGLTVGWAEGGMRLNFLEASPSLAINGREAQPGVVNYMLGDNPDGWQTGLPTYGVVTYEELYPGISLAFNGQGSEVAAVFQLEPGAEPSQIGWTFDWAAPVLDGRGALQLVSDGGAETAVTLSPPQAWQEVDGRDVPVSAAFRLGEDGRVGLSLAEYDRGRPLILATILSYAPLGGGPTDVIKDITIGPSGQIYVSGETYAPIFPLANPYQSTHGGELDVFVSVFAPDGQSLVYSTFLGGGDNEFFSDAAVDALGKVFVTGATSSENFPLANPYQPTTGGGFGDAFITVFAPDGQSLVYSTFLGGDENDWAHGIALGANGYAYIAGETTSSDFPLANPLPPPNGGNLGGFGFITVFAPDGQSLIYSTFLGGNSIDEATAIAVDGNGRAYVAGYTASSNFPLVNPYQSTISGGIDIFVTIFAPDGQSLDYSTFLGGAASEDVQHMAIDGAGRIYITGGTSSWNFPMVNPYQPFYGGDYQDGYATVFAADGQSLVYSTYLGGSGFDTSSGIAVDENGRAYVAGTSRSENFPIHNPYQAALNSFEDAVVTVFAPNGQPYYSTFLGGNGGEGAHSIAVDENGRAYVAGFTSSSDFPLVDPFQSSFSFTTEGFITILTPDGQSLDYSTYLHGGYPGGPTAVEVTDFAGAEQGSAVWLLALSLLLLLLAGAWLANRSRYSK